MSGKKKYLFLLLTVAFAAGLSWVSAKNTPPARKTLARAWTVIQEALTADDSVVRENAVQSLEVIKSQQSENSLVSSLRDESEYVQIWAARSLARRGNPIGKDTLLEILTRNPEPDGTETGPLAALSKMKALARGRVRGEAAKVLGILNDPSLIPVLKEAKRDNDGRVRDGAGVALAIMGNRSETLLFEKALRDPDKGVRLAAVEALESIRDPRSAPVLVAALKDPEEGVRSFAVRALGASKVNEAAAASFLLKDPSGVVRESAVWALGEMGQADRMAVLEKMLADQNPIIRIAAAEALGKLGNSFGYETLQRELASNENDARIRAAAALGSIPDDKAEFLAVKLLEDGNLRVRIGAAISIFKLAGFYAPAKKTNQ